MKKSRVVKSMIAVFLMCMMFSMTAFAQEDTLTLVSVTMTAEDEGLVEAAGHGNIFPDPSMYDAVFSNNSQISLVFNTRSFGVNMDTYKIYIYKGDKVDAEKLITRKTGDFAEEKGSYDYTFNWDTTDVTTITPGVYTIVCSSYYYDTAKGEDVLNNVETFNVTLEDYKLVLDRKFVERLYNKVFNREADATGLASWSKALYEGKLTGSQVVESFFNSQEFLNMNTTEAQYIELLYAAIFDRVADAPGKESWQAVLDQGFSRTYVLKGFLDSGEFTTLCNNYGIVKGTVTLTESRDKNVGVTQFVSRLYNMTLNRRADAAGLNDWTGKLLAKKATPQNVAFGFFFADEMHARNLTDAEFVTLLYNAMMNREPDAAGLETWTTLLAGGMTREKVFQGFGDSVEFGKIVASYGIK